MKRCKPCKTRKCSKRKGSPRFTAPCKAKFRGCMKETLKETGSMRVAGKTCMKALHSCAGSRTQKTAVRKYKRAKSR
jgi:hypothetical protein